MLLSPIVLVIVVGVGAGCKENPVGRPCFIPGPQGDAGVDLTIVGAPALECQSRLCLRVAGASPDLCTGECSSDGDCDTSPESPCQGGFVCMVPVVTGNFCCNKYCVCRDYVTLQDGGIPEPEACNAEIPANECCNLEGRRGNPDYPTCQN